MNKLKKLLKKQWFTLVELIIVIAIIAVLAVSAFMMLTKWLGKSRDSRRLWDMWTMDKSLSVWLVDTDNTSGTLPLPDDSVEITYSGAIIGYQWKYGETVIKEIGNMAKAPLDPSDTTRYTYRINENKTKYELFGLLEEDTAYIWNEVRAIDNTNRVVVTRGYELWVITDENKVGIEDIEAIGTGMDLESESETYIAWLDEENKIEWNGSVLQVLDRIDENGFGAPEDCVEWFIGVPGNLTFWQPWFCVAKYEMSYAWLTGTDNSLDRNTYSYLDNWEQWVIVSQAWNSPIAEITQTQAIAECKAMWEGYHLITNNEWMTIARNIEWQSVNWSGWVVWENFIYNWISNESTMWCVWNWANNLPTVSIRATVTWADICGWKNKLTLSNGEEIWDLAGNIREHVNGANTIDGSNNNTMQVQACGRTNSAWAWNSFYGNDWVAECGFSNGYSYSNQWPSTANLNANNGIWRIYNYWWSLSDRVFIRGGHADDGAYAGVFALNLSRTSASRHRYVGFRCVE